MSERRHTCPICDESVARDDNRAFPFCSSRCRMIDLGNWLDGAYTVPGEPTIDAVDIDDAEG